MGRSLREMAARRRLGAKSLLGALGDGQVQVVELIADPAAHPHWEMTLAGGTQVCFDADKSFAFDQLVHLVASGADVQLVAVREGPRDQTLEMHFRSGHRELAMVAASYCLP